MEQFILSIIIALVVGLIIGLIMGIRAGKKRVIKKIEAHIKKEKINFDLEKIFKPKHDDIVKEDFFEIPSE
jgi:uncharacterized membrane-anchored protein YhcB (DUF1043 family)